MVSGGLRTAVDVAVVAVVVAVGFVVEDLPPQGHKNQASFQVWLRRRGTVTLCKAKKKKEERFKVESSEKQCLLIDNTFS